MRRQEVAWRREQRRKPSRNHLKSLSKVPVRTHRRLLQIRRLWHALRTMQGFRPQGVSLKETLVRVIDGEYERLREELEAEGEGNPEYAGAIKRLLADASHGE